MKRTLLASALLIAVTAMAVQKPAHESLPNFDVRDAGAILRTASPGQQTAVAALQQRVPGLKVTHSKLLQRPEFFSSFSSFLSGPDGVGLGVKAESASGFAKTDPHRAIKAFLNEQTSLLGYGSEILTGATIRRDYIAQHNQMRTVIFEQQYDGIPVFDAVLMGHITKRGELVNLFTRFVPDTAKAALAGLKGNAAVPTISAQEAVALAATAIGDNLDASGVSVVDQPAGALRKQTLRAAPLLKGDQYAELTWLPLNGGAIRLCWRVIVISKARGEGYLFVVDAESGQLYVRRGLTSYISDVSLRVYTSDSPSPFSPGWFTPNTNQPPLIPRVLVVTNAINTNASPNGWINDGQNETLGNNVDAHLDRNNDDLPDLPRPVGSPFRVFDFPLDLTQDPTNYSSASVVQCFYLNNFMHDRLYELGFNEAAGNFQVNNFGRGGLENDAVSADAQDGGGFDNANMLTLPDGIPPRMQMYIFSGPVPMRDGDLDAEVVCHEYTHGLSNRRVGGGVGISEIQTAGMGEGWSDFYAMSLLSEPTDDIAGNYPQGGYVTFLLTGTGIMENYYFGIRRYPYSTNLLKNPLTFKDIDPTQAIPHTGIPRSPLFPFTPFDAPEPHNAGEVWCVTLWEMRANLIGKYGWTNGNHLALQLVTDAMALCPVDPNFLQSRDAIVQADRVLTGGANYFEIWSAFAKRGMGGSATSPDSSTPIGVVEAYDFPGIAFVAASIDDSVTGNNNTAIDYNECVDIHILLRNDANGLASNIVAQLVTTNPFVTVVQGTSAYPTIAPGALGQELVPFRISTSSNFVCGTSIPLALIIQSPFTTKTNFFFLDTGLISDTPVVRNNSIAVAIPDRNTNGVSSTVNVSGFSGAVGKVVVSLFISHSYDFDLTVDLIGPDGTTVNLINNEGGPGDNFGTNCSPFSARTTFDDNADLPISLGAAPFVGVYRPEVPLQVFKGKSGSALNGAWRLRVVDAFTNGVGTLNCWSLSLYPTICTDGGGSCAADLAVSAVASPDPVALGNDLAYSVSVANTRSIAASAVVVSNLVSPSATVISAVSSQGACTVAGNLITCALGDLAGNASASISIVAHPTALGSLTNVITANAALADSNPANNSIKVVSQVIPASPSIVGAGALLVSESYSPATGGIEPGETVTVDLTLKNEGTAAVTNLLATLQAGNGITSPSAAQNYGAIAPNGSVTRSFSFTASASSGSSVQAVLQLQDGLTALSNVTFTFAIGANATFANTAPIVINQAAAATPFPSTISISGVAGILSKISVTLTKLSHSYPDDIDALLVGPHGQQLMLMSDVGGSNSVANRTLVFDPTATTRLGDESAIAGGLYLPTDFEPGDVLPGAPAGPYGTSFNPFIGTDPNGVWSLYIWDDAAGDAGLVSGGWTLDVSTVVPVNPVANLSVSISPAGAVTQGEPFSYLLTVANLGPSAATNVVLSNAALGLVIESVSANVGSAAFSSSGLTLTVTSLVSGASAVATITAHPASFGSFTNIATVVSGMTDPDVANNTAISVGTASRAHADLILSVSQPSGPLFITSNLAFTVTVSNAGPNRVHGAQVTNNLPAGWTFVGATNGFGITTNQGNLVISTFDLLRTGEVATAIVYLTSTVAGTATNLFDVSAAPDDANFTNNHVALVTVVNYLAPVLTSAGMAIVAEASPADGSVSGGEAVTLSFALRNVGTADTSNLVATLQNSGGVIPAGGPATYGVVAANGAVVSRQVALTASAGASGSITATFRLQDGAQDLGIVSFIIPVAQQTAQNSSGAIVVNDHGAAVPYPATATISGLSGVITKATVTLHGLSHSYPADLDILLVGPAGQKVMLMSDSGSGFAVNNVDLTFDDLATGVLPFGAAIASGRYKPTDSPPGDSLPSPAPTGSFGTNLSVFNGSNPNGIWSLYVFDQAAGDGGAINGGWTLNLETSVQIDSAADLSVSVTAPASAEANSLLTYTLNVANNGPSIATGVVVTDTLPAGFTFAGASSSQGPPPTATSGVLTANLGTMPSGASATITISGFAPGLGTITNRASVAASQLDPVLANNVAVSVSENTTPALAVRRSGSNVVVSWSSSATGYVLETASNLIGPWAAAGVSITVVGTRNEATIPATATAFYRLRKP